MEGYKNLGSFYDKTQNQVFSLFPKAELKWEKKTTKYLWETYFFY